jgi:aspartate oxidase
VQIEEGIKSSKGSYKTTIKAMIELKNAILVAKAVATCAMRREESRGAHFRNDFPEKDHKFKSDTIINIEDIGEISAVRN